MTEINEIEQVAAKEHEMATAANVCLGGYNMDDFFPCAEVKCYRAVLEASDLDRIYLLRETTFQPFTNGETYKVTDIRLGEKYPERVQLNVDLRERVDLSPILVGNDLHTGSLTVIDGNHRITSHYLMYRDLTGVPVYVYIHPEMDKWNFKKWGFQAPTRG